MLDKLYCFVDLDRSIVAEDEREKLYKQLEEIALNQESVVIMFESQNSSLVQIPFDTDSDNPKTILIKPISGTVKVYYCCQINV